MLSREVTWLLVMALDSFLLTRRALLSSIVVRDADSLNDPFRLRPGQIDRQQPILQVHAQHLHAFRQHEGALELARGDATVEILASLVVVLSAADNELVFLDGHIELIASETRDRQRDPQPLGLAVLASDPLNVVGQIAVGGLAHAIERTLDFVESEEEGAGQRRNSGHGLKALVSDFDGALSAPPRPAARASVLLALGPVPQNMGSSG